MKVKLGNIGKLFKLTFKEWWRKDPFRESAVIAYYAIFAIPGLLVFVINISGYFFGKDAIDAKITLQIAKTFGAATAKQVNAMLVHGIATKTTIAGSVIGFFFLLLGATGVFVELQKNLNMIWEVKVVPQKGVLRILKARLFSFGLILAIAFLLLISLVISTLLASIGDSANVDAGGWLSAVFNVINFLISLAVISVLFALMFKILPDAKIKWQQVWLGSAVTGLLFTIGKTALAFYFAKAQPGSGYGTAASVILILLWTSYSSMILFFGAEFTVAYAKLYSRRVDPTAIAEMDRSGTT
jgi:membrane protein